eukprot:s1982_g1.t2
MASSENTPSKFVLHEYEERRISLQVNLSRGTCGHPWRLCILFLREKCHKGDTCGFCHLPHGTELDAAVVLQLLKSEISVFSKISSADPRRICLVFERMSLAGLVSTACTILPQERFRKVAKNYQSF